MVQASIQINPAAESFLIQRGDVGVLLLHGLGGTTNDFRALASLMTASGISVLAQRLAGHGATPDYLAKFHAADWTKTCDQGLEQLLTVCRDVFVLGVSFGGVLATDAALRQPRIRGVITVNPAWSFKPNDKLARYALKTIKLFRSDLPKFSISKTDLEKHAQHGSLKSWPIAVLLEAQTFTWSVRKRFSQLKTPYLEIVSQSDPYIRVGASDGFTGAHKRVAISFTGHRPLRDPTGTAQIAAEVSQFIK